MTSLKKGTIAGYQLIYLIIGFSLGSALVFAPGRAAQQDAWIAIMIGAAESMFFALIYTALARRFPGKTLVEIEETVFGPYLGKLIAAIFLWYLFHLGSIVIRNFTDFFTIAVMAETPSLVFAVLLVLVSALAVSYGLEVIARCSLILLPITVFLLTTTFLLQLNQFDFKNFLPILEISFRDLLGASHALAAFPFGETVTFLMFFPFLDRPKAGRRPTLIAILLTAILLITVSARVIGVLGATAGLVTYPSLEAIKFINVPFVSLRLEVIVMINFLAMGFLKISLLHYGTVLGLGQIFKFRSIRPLIIPVGILMIIFSIINFSGISENIEFAETGYPIYTLPFQLGIPLLTLIVALVRKLPRRPVKC